MSYDLLIAEKPSAAKKIAELLADGKPIKKLVNKVSYFECIHNKKKLVVASGVGHLFSLVQDKKGWHYPEFNIHWAPIYEANKDALFAKPYSNLLERLAKKAKNFVVCTDFDVEGSVIGLNIIKFLCNQKDAQRMRFSTLTQEDVIEAYNTKLKHLDWGQCLAGETRHKLDWYYGINLSRALTASIKAVKSFKIMSIGRVQGPALKLIVDLEKEIQKFKPVPYWELQLLTKDFEAGHKDGKFWDEKQAKKIYKKVKDEKKAVVDNIETRSFKQPPPHPFDLTTLQTESHSQFGFAPKLTLILAQSLYSNGYLSYPRTSSQQLSSKLGLKKILQHLTKQSVYKKLAEKVLKFPKLVPNNGKKTDPAHPAIFPTGVIPKSLNQRERKVYDLVVKRFLSTFGQPATRESVDLTLQVKSELFVAKGTRTIEPGWHMLYFPYVKLQEVELPAYTLGDKIVIKKIINLAKETKPPKRFTQSSILKELEKKNLGTKSTRAEIIDTLYNRGYVDGKQVQATKFGIETITILEKYVPEILDEELTRHFEEDMDQIYHEKKKPDKVLHHAQVFLKKILKKFKAKEKKIGEELLESIQEARKVASHERILGVDSKTKKQVLVRIGRYGPLVQLGEKTKDEKPHFAPVPKGTDIDKLTLKDALEYFSFPKSLGQTKVGESVSVGIGPWGPFVKYGKKYVSLKDTDPHDVDLKLALKFIKEKEKLDKNKIIHDFGSIKVLNGMYGPYCTDGKKNVKVPKGKDLKKITKKECEELIASAPLRRFRKFKKKAKK